MRTNQTYSASCSPAATRTTAFPGARAGDFESCLKRLAKDKRKYSKIVRHASGKINVESVHIVVQPLVVEVVSSKQWAT